MSDCYDPFEQFPRQQYGYPVPKGFNADQFFNNMTNGICDEITDAYNQINNMKVRKLDHARDVQERLRNRAQKRLERSAASFTLNSDLSFWANLYRQNDRFIFESTRGKITQEVIDSHLVLLVTNDGSKSLLKFEKNKVILTTYGKMGSELSKVQATLREDEVVAIIIYLLKCGLDFTSMYD